MATVAKARQPFIPIDLGARVTIHQTYMGRPYVNVVGVFLQSAASSITGVAQTVFDNWQAMFVPLLSDKWHLDGVVAQKLDKEDGEVGTHYVGGVQGNDETFALPRGVAVVLSLGTSGAGRARHGRIYLSGICESSFENEQNTVKDSLALPIEAGWPTLAHLQTNQTEHGTMAVLSHSRNQNGGKRSGAVYDPATNTWSGVQEPGSVHNITSLKVRRTVGSQRRRNG